MASVLVVCDFKLVFFVGFLFSFFFFVKFFFVFGYDDSTFCCLDVCAYTDCVEGIDAIPEKGYLVYYGDHMVQLDYPQEPGTNEPRKGVSFHHGRFIMKLREAAQSNSNVECVEGICELQLRICTPDSLVVAFLVCHYSKIVCLLHLGLF